MFNEKLSVYKPFFRFLYLVAHALEDFPIRESDNKSSWLLTISRPKHVSGVQYLTWYQSVT